MSSIYFYGEKNSSLSCLVLAWLGLPSLVLIATDLQKCGAMIHKLCCWKKATAAAALAFAALAFAAQIRPSHTYHFRCYYIRILFRLSFYFFFSHDISSVANRNSLSCSVVCIHTQCVCVVQKSLRLISIESMNFIIRRQFPWQTLFFCAFFSNSWHVQFQIEYRDAAVYLHHTPQQRVYITHVTDFKCRVFRSIMCFILGFRRFQFRAEHFH